MNGIPMERLAKEAYDAHVDGSIDAPCWALLDREEQRRWCDVARAVLDQFIDRPGQSK